MTREFESSFNPSFFRREIFLAFFGVFEGVYVYFTPPLYVLDQKRGGVEISEQKDAPKSARSGRNPHLTAAKRPGEQLWNDWMSELF